LIQGQSLLRPETVEVVEHGREHAAVRLVVAGTVGSDEDEEVLRCRGFGRMSVAASGIFASLRNCEISARSWLNSLRIACNSSRIVFINFRFK
jgi:hypothetical protein